MSLSFPCIPLFFFQHQCLSLIHSNLPSSCLSYSLFLFLPSFLTLFLTLPPMTASLAVEWGVLSVSGMSVTGQHIRRRAAAWREFGEAGCVGAETGSRGLEEVKRRGRDRWGRADKHERSNKRGEGLRKENKRWLSGVQERRAKMWGWKGEMEDLKRGSRRTETESRMLEEKKIEEI